MRGTPGGKHFAVGSFVSARETACGPRLGLLALNLAIPQGVIEGSSLVIDIASSKIVYLRVLSGGRRDRLQTPEISGAADDACAFTTPELRPAWKSQTDDQAIGTATAKIAPTNP